MQEDNALLVLGERDTEDMKRRKKYVSVLAGIYGKIHNARIRRTILSVIRKVEGEFFSEVLREIASQYHDVHIGAGSYGACFDFDRVQPGVEIGKYCSLARNVYLYTRTHPIDRISTHPAFFNKAVGACEQDRISFGKLRIGNDVWIGQNAVVLPSCSKIGNGAVVGANAVVTKDVPDYAIVAGVPARILRYRFSEEQIKELNETQWWTWDMEFIAGNVELFDSFEGYERAVHKYREWKKEKHNQ